MPPIYAQMLMFLPDKYSLDSIECALFGEGLGRHFSQKSADLVRCPIVLGIEHLDRIFKWKMKKKDEFDSTF